MKSSNGMRPGAPGGAPRTLPRQRRSLSLSTTKLAKAPRAMASTITNSAEPSTTALGLEASASAPALTLASTAPAASASRPRVADPPIVDRLSTPGGRSAVASNAAADEDEGVHGGRLNADGAVLPPWACPRAHKIRYQPTTLLWKVHQLPKGMHTACQKLDARRYQSTYSELGLDFRLRGAPKLVRTTTLHQLERDGATVPPREGAKSPAAYKFQHPTWWGCGPKDSEGMKLQSSYEDHGVNFQEMGIGKEQSQSISVGLLDGQFEHKNPFMAQWGRRTEGGTVVYDTSVAAKSGCCARDPNCPKVRTRGF